MAGQRDVNARLRRRLHGIIMAADGFAQLPALADRHGEEGMMGDENARLVRRHGREFLAKHVHLLMVDPPILDGQRSRGVEAQYRDRLILVERA